MKKMLSFEMLEYVYKSFVILPTPMNLTTWWNLGSMLGICLVIQILSGLFLSMHYCPNVNEAFESVIHIVQDVKYGWMIRSMHMNGASFYFICMFIHVGRGMYYHSFMKFYVWYIGVLILLMSMGTAFLGYVLPWGQMSFWGATVITNLMSAIPYVGSDLVYWLWGGFSINNATLNRFYTLHFIMPFIIFVLVIFHLMMLHLYGSNNPLGLKSNKGMIPFHSYFTYKDIIGFFMLFMLLMLIILQNTMVFSDPDNSIMANSLITPVHIQPEWYFLFAYAILRSIPSKLGGVLALLMSILILMILSFTDSKMEGLTFYPMMQYMYWMFIVTFFMLTWVGSKPIEYPYFQLSQILSFMYFMYFFLSPYVYDFWDFILFYNGK